MVFRGLGRSCPRLGAGAGRASGGLFLSLPCGGSRSERSCPHGPRRWGLGGPYLAVSLGSLGFFASGFLFHLILSKLSRYFGLFTFLGLLPLPAIRFRFRDLTYWPPLFLFQLTLLIHSYETIFLVELQILADHDLMDLFYRCLFLRIWH
jgi:hypothetical protein